MYFKILRQYCGGKDPQSAADEIMGLCRTKNRGAPRWESRGLMTFLFCHRSSREPWGAWARMRMHMSSDMHIHSSIMAVRRSTALLLPDRYIDIMPR